MTNERSNPTNAVFGKTLNPRVGDICKNSSRVRNEQENPADE